MTLKELQQLFRHLESDERPLVRRNHLLFKLLGTTGMRRQEVVDLTWEQVDLNNNTVRVLGKGKKSASPLHSLVIPLFEEYRKGLLEYQLHPTEPVFLNENGEKFNVRGLHVVFKDITGTSHYLNVYPC